MNTEINVPPRGAMAVAGVLIHPPPRPVSQPPRLPRALRQWTILALLAVLTYLLITRFVFQSVQVVGASMVPTLHNTDRYFLNHWAYFVRPPQRGDIVVIKDPTDGVYAVKRIIGMPGEAVYLSQGTIYVNGERLSEPYLAAGTPTFTRSHFGEELILCGKDQYFVLGDNRNQSLDSRIYGPVARHNIVGPLMR